MCVCVWGGGGGRCCIFSGFKFDRLFCLLAFGPMAGMHQ